MPEKTLLPPRDLQSENEQLRARLAEAEETLRALGSGEVDAFVIHGRNGARIFTLQGAEHAYRVIVEAMGEGAVTTSVEGIILYGNSALTRMLGTPLSRIMGRPLQDFMAEGDRDHLDALLRQTLSGPVRQRLLLRTAQGRFRAAYFSSALLPLEEGELQVCMVLTDLADLEAAAAELQTLWEREKILAASEQRFRLFAEAVPNMVWTADPSGKVDFFNQRWSEFTGLSGSAGFGSGWEEVLHPHDRERTLANWQQSVATGRPYRIEHRVRRADGRYRWHVSRALPLRDEQGGISRWYGTATDIDESKRTAEALRESQHRLRMATEAAVIGIWAWDPRQDEIVCSRECRQVIGLAPESRVDLKSLLQAVHPEDRGRVESGVQSILETGRDYQLEFRVVRPEGSTRWLQMKGKAFREEAPPPGHLHGVIIDITETRQREEELKKLTEQLTRSNQELKEFAYIASHDLQEPLRVVTGFLDLLRRRYHGRLDREADEFIDFAVGGATRMHNLIRDLLTYSRVGTREADLVPVDSSRVLKQALDNLRMSIEETGARIEQGELPPVLGDETMLVQLFQNLLSNALKFRGPEPPEIRIAAEKREKKWLFSVRDRGIGLEPRQAQRIFQIFQRLHPADKYQGTGIGLAICKKIIDRHGGRIWVESQPGEGATFYFTLPRKQPGGEPS